MDKRILANLEVKAKIRTAFFTLLSEKPISEITVTELIQEAGVARSSFYRNYNSLHDVLMAIVDGIVQSFTEANPIETVDFTSYAYMCFVFRFYYRIRDEVLCLLRAGYSQLFLTEITNYHMEYLGNMSSTSIDRYDIYYYSGALVSVIGHWLESGAKESVEDMAQKFLSLVQKK